MVASYTPTYVLKERQTTDATRNARGCAVCGCVYSTTYYVVGIYYCPNHVPKAVEKPVT